MSYLQTNILPLQVQEVEQEAYETAIKIVNDHPNRARKDYWEEVRKVARDIYNSLN